MANPFLQNLDQYASPAERTPTLSRTRAADPEVEPVETNLPPEPPPENDNPFLRNLDQYRGEFEPGTGYETYDPTFMGAMRARIQQGEHVVELGNLGSIMMTPFYTPEQEARFEELMTAPPGEIPDAPYLFDDFIGPMVEQIPLLFGKGGIGYQALVGGATGAVTGAAVGALGGPAAIGTATAGGILGLKGGAAVGTFRIEGGNAFAEFLQMARQIERDTGEVIPRDAIIAAATLTGAINAGLELVGLAQIARIPGLGRLMKGLNKGGAQRLLRNPGTRRQLIEYGRAIGRITAVEGGTETLQEITNISVGQFLKDATTTQGAEYFTWENAIRAGHAGVQGALAGGGFGVVGGAPGTAIGIANPAGVRRGAIQDISNRARAEAAAEGKDILGQEAAVDAALVEALPELERIKLEEDETAQDAEDQQEANEERENYEEDARAASEERVDAAEQADQDRQDAEEAAAPEVERTVEEAEDELELAEEELDRHLRVGSEEADPQMYESDEYKQSLARAQKRVDLAVKGVDKAQKKAEADAQAADEAAISPEPEEAAPATEPTPVELAKTELGEAEEALVRARDIIVPDGGVQSAVQKKTISDARNRIMRAKRAVARAEKEEVKAAEPVVTEPVAETPVVEKPVKPVKKPKAEPEPVSRVTKLALELDDLKAGVELRVPRQPSRRRNKQTGKFDTRKWMAPLPVLDSILEMFGGIDATSPDMAGIRSRIEGPNRKFIRKGGLKAWDGLIDNVSPNDDTVLGALMGRAREDESGGKLSDIIEEAIDAELGGQPERTESEMEAILEVEQHREELERELAERDIDITQVEDVEALAREMLGEEAAVTEPTETAKPGWEYVNGILVKKKPEAEPTETAKPEAKPTIKEEKTEEKVTIIEGRKVKEGHGYDIVGGRQVNVSSRDQGTGLDEKIGAGKMNNGLNVFFPAEREVEEEGKIFVVDEVDGKTGRFIRHRVILGQGSALMAKRMHSLGTMGLKPHVKTGRVVGMTPEVFDKWMEREGSLDKPVHAKTPVAEETPSTTPTKGKLRKMAVRLIRRMTGRNRGLHGTGAEEFSEFDRAFMYSGEGSTYVGWGFYFATMWDVATTYRDIGARKHIKDVVTHNVILANGKEVPYDESSPLHGLAHISASSLKRKAELRLGRAVVILQPHKVVTFYEQLSEMDRKLHARNIQTTLKRWIRNFESHAVRLEKEPFLRKKKETPIDFAMERETAREGRMRAEIKKYRESVKKFKASLVLLEGMIAANESLPYEYSTRETVEGKGRILMAEIPGDEVLLDWRAKLVDQHPNVIPMLMAMGADAQISTDELNQQYSRRVRMDAANEMSGDAITKVVYTQKRLTATIQRMIADESERVDVGTATKAKKNWEFLMTMAPEVDHNVLYQIAEGTTERPLHDITAEDLYHSLMNKVLLRDMPGRESEYADKAQKSAAKREVSDMFNAVGIVGQRFLDQGSRRGYAKKQILLNGKRSESLNQPTGTRAYLVEAEGDLHRAIGFAKKEIAHIKARDVNPITMYEQNSIDEFQRMIDRGDKVTLEDDKTHNYVIWDETLINIVEQNATRDTLRRMRGDTDPWTGRKRDKTDKAFIALADAQRGKPERAMGDVQAALGGGVLSYVVEHVGDIIHRMSQYGATEVSIGHGLAADKVEKTLYTLENSFERENRVQQISNAKFSSIPLAEYDETAEIALKLYAEAHEALTPYSRPQFLAQRAAIALGRGDFGMARIHLRELKQITDLPIDEYRKKLADVQLDAKGNPIPYADRTDHKAKKFPAIRRIRSAKIGPASTPADIFKIPLKSRKYRGDMDVAEDGHFRITAEDGQEFDLIKRTTRDGPIFGRKGKAWIASNVTDGRMDTEIGESYTKKEALDNIRHAVDEVRRRNARNPPNIRRIRSTKNDDKRSEDQVMADEVTKSIARQAVLDLISAFGYKLRDVLIPGQNVYKMFVPQLRRAVMHKGKIHSSNLAIGDAQDINRRRTSDNKLHMDWAEELNNALGGKGVPTPVEGGFRLDNGDYVEAGFVLPNGSFMARDTFELALYEIGKSMSLGHLRRMRVTVKEAATLIPGSISLLGRMIPAEKEFLTQDLVEKTVAMFGDMIDAEEVAAAAWAGRVKRGWYTNSAQTILEVFGAADANRFTGLLAALSPRTSVEANALNALKVWRGWLKAGKPTTERGIMQVLRNAVPSRQPEQLNRKDLLSRVRNAKKKFDIDISSRGDNATLAAELRANLTQQQLKELSVLDSWFQNSVRILSAEHPEDVKLSGAKVDSFMHNLRGEVEFVTNDAWMAAFFGMNPDLVGTGRQTVDSQDEMGLHALAGKEYLAMSSLIREAAEILTRMTGMTWTPAEVQETVWSWVKSLIEQVASKDEIRDAAEIIRTTGVDPTRLAATPDFAALFARDSFLEVLKGAGLDQSAKEAARARNESVVGRNAVRLAEEKRAAIGIPKVRFAGHLNNAAARLRDNAAAAAKAKGQQVRVRRIVNAAQLERFVNQKGGLSIGAFAEQFGQRFAGLGRGLSLENIREVVQAIVDSVRDVLPGLPKINVVESGNALPLEYQVALEFDYEGTKAFWDEASGEIWVLADNFIGEPVSSVVSAIFHEGVAHHGVRQILTKNGELDAVFRAIFDTNIDTPLMRSVMSKYAEELDAQDPDDQLALADEYVAALAETGDSTGKLAQVIAAVRALLRKIGLVTHYTANDVLRLLRQSAKNLSGVPLSSVTISTEAEMTGTGEVIVLSRPADVAIRQIEKRVAVVEEIRACLRA